MIASVSVVFMFRMVIFSKDRSSKWFHRGNVPNSGFKALDRIVDHGSINAHNLDAVSNPIRGQVDSTAVAAGFYDFLDQFFAMDFKFNLVAMARFLSVGYRI